MLGSSGVTYSDTGPAGTLPNLLRAELTERRPDATWVVEAEEIPPARDMPDRVAAAVEAHRPDVVVAMMASNYFTYDSVSARVRRRWPALFRATRALSARVKLVAGGGVEGSASPRGWLFRGPRWLASRLVGAEPYMKLDNATDNSRLALEYLGGLPDIVAVCKLPATSRDVTLERRQVNEERVARFHAAMIDTCDRHSIRYYELLQALSAAGLEHKRTKDGLHPTLETRGAEAWIQADLVLQGLEVATSAGRIP